MRHSNHVIQYTRELVSQYCKRSEDNDVYLLVDDLPDFIVHEFASVLMIEHPDYASEATGNDNIHYKNLMQTTLINFLRNSTDKDCEIEFVSTWRDSVADYFIPEMQRLIEAALEDYRCENGVRVK